MNLYKIYIGNNSDQFFVAADNLQNAVAMALTAHGNEELAQKDAYEVRVLAEEVYPQVYR